MDYYNKIVGFINYTLLNSKIFVEVVINVYVGGVKIKSFLI